MFPHIHLGIICPANGSTPGPRQRSDAFITLLCALWVWVLIQSWWKIHSNLLPRQEDDPTGFLNKISLSSWKSQLRKWLLQGSYLKWPRFLQKMAINPNWPTFGHFRYRDKFELQTFKWAGSRLFDRFSLFGWKVEKRYTCSFPEKKVGQLPKVANFWPV